MYSADYNSSVIWSYIYCNRFNDGIQGGQWLSGRVLDSRPRGRGLEPHRRHCVVSLSKTHYPSLVLVQPRKTHTNKLTERLLMEHKESNQTNKQINGGMESRVELCQIWISTVFLNSMARLSIKVIYQVYFWSRQSTPQVLSFFSTHW